TGDDQPPGALLFDQDERGPRLLVEQPPWSSLGHHRRIRPVARKKAANPVAGASSGGPRRELKPVGGGPVGSSRCQEEYRPGGPSLSSQSAGGIGKPARGCGERSLSYDDAGAGDGVTLAHRTGGRSRGGPRAEDAEGAVDHRVAAERGVEVRVEKEVRAFRV